MYLYFELIGCPSSSLSFSRSALSSCFLKMATKKNATSAIFQVNRISILKMAF